jgi:hypothetical protein
MIDAIMKRGVKSAKGIANALNKAGISDGPRKTMGRAERLEPLQRIR